MSVRTPMTLSALVSGTGLRRASLGSRHPPTSSWSRLVGFTLGAEALGAFLGGAILTGQLLAVMLSNAGGAWDNAKKHVEAGHLGGKSSPRTWPA